MTFSIGEFSRITSLSIKSLRLYHEKGILVPADVDPFTGYRHYHEADIERAKAIQALKAFDFTLAEIKDVLDECDDESDLLPQLEKKRLEITRKIGRYQEVSGSLEQIIQQQRESTMKVQSSFEVEEKELDTMLVAGHRMKGSYGEIGKGFALLAKKLGRHINGKAMALYYDCDYKEKDADFEACFPVRKGRDGDGITVRELKGGKCLSLVHQGPYDTLGESYKKLFEVIHKKKLKTRLPSREVYLKGPGMILKGNPKNFLTEIQILIEE